MAENTTNNGNGSNAAFQTTAEALMKGMEGFISSKTVVGDPVHLGDTILLPLVDVSFGMGAGTFLGEKKKNSAGGIGGKISPCAVLVINNGVTKMVSTKSQDAISKILDMIPDYVNMLMNKIEERRDPEKAADRAEARAEAAEELKEKLNLEDL